MPFPAVRLMRRFFMSRKLPPLTPDQREFVCRALTEFDAGSLSVEDALSIVDAFAEVGIRPGPELSELMAGMGFNADKLGRLVRSGVEAWSPYVC